MDSSKCFIINILNDNLLEGVQIFTVTITNPPDMVDSLSSSTTVSINDDEGKKTLLSLLYQSLYTHHIPLGTFETEVLTLIMSQHIPHYTLYLFSK